MATTFDTTLSSLGIGRTSQQATAKSRGLNEMDQGDFIALQSFRIVPGGVIPGRKPVATDGIYQDIPMRNPVNVLSGIRCLLGEA